MFLKSIIILLLIIIFFSLGSGLYYLIRDQGHSDRVVKALTWRIAISLGLFILLIVAFFFGWISPHPV